MSACAIGALYSNFLTCQRTIPHLDSVGCFIIQNGFKGGYLDFSHLTELEKIYITEIYMKKQYKSSIIKNHKITNKKSFDGISLKGFVAS